MASITQPSNEITRSADAALLRGLVEIYSPSGKENAASTWLVAQMQARGFRARVDEAGNAVGEIGQGPVTVMLLGHIDTVPGYIPVREESGILHGRGAVDAKGPLAAYVAAVSRLLNDPLLEQHRVVVVGAVEEETASSKGARYILETYAQDRPANLVIGEPSGWSDLTLGYKGRILVNVAITRELQHTARAGGSAAEDGVSLWNALKSELVDPFNASPGTGVKRTTFETLDPSLRTFQTIADGFSERAELLLGFRLPLDCPAENIITFFTAYAKRVEEETGGRFNLEFSGAELAYKAPKNTALVRAFLAGVRAQQGEPRFKVKTGTSDLNVLAPIWQMPSLAYGPGDSSFDHTPHEQINLAEYAKGIDVLETALRHLLTMRA